VLISSQEVWIKGVTLEIDTEKVTMVWSWQTGGLGWSSQIGSGNGSAEKREGRKSKEIFRRYSDLEILGVNEKVSKDRKRWRKIITSLVP